VHPYSVTPARLAPDLGSQGLLWSENDAISSWVDIHAPLIAIVSCKCPHSLQHQYVPPHHVPIWCTNLSFLVKPLAKDPLIANHKLAIMMTNCEHDLVEHALIDPNPCKCGNVVGIDLTFPIV
jgi:hypothetical protein